MSFPESATLEKTLMINTELNIPLNHESGKIGFKTGKESQIQRYSDFLNDIKQVTEKYSDIVTSVTI